MNDETTTQEHDEAGQQAPVGGAIEQTHTVMQMETPKGANGVYELPCGYLDPRTQELSKDVELREITGHEEDMLASQQVPSHAKITQLLAGCVTRIGSVTDPGLIAGIVQQLPVGDRVYLIFSIRRVTLGDELPVREKCPECKTTTLFMVDLGEDLQPKPMKDPMKRVFDVTLPSGTTARFRVSTGLDEANLTKLTKRQKHKADALSQALLMRLEMLGGEKPTLKMVKSLGMRDRNFLREKYQEVEGGVDTTLELECPACGHEWEKDLDLSAANFFFPGGRRRP
jgi:hypothetical protein